MLYLCITGLVATNFHSTTMAQVVSVRAAYIRVFVYLGNIYGIKIYVPRRWVYFQLLCWLLVYFVRFSAQQPIIKQHELSIDVAISNRFWVLTAIHRAHSIVSILGVILLCWEQKFMAYYICSKICFLLLFPSEYINVFLDFVSVHGLHKLRCLENY